MFTFPHSLFTLFPISTLSIALLIHRNKNALQRYYKNCKLHISASCKCHCPPNV
jgi:hypothetical protein